MKLWPEATTEFQRRWNHNWLTVFLPGFVVFGVGGFTNIRPIAAAGALIAFAGLFRGFGLIRKFRRCTGCGRVNHTRVGDDGSCFYCGVDLPLNGTD